MKLLNLPLLLLSLLAAPAALLPACGDGDATTDHGDGGDGADGDGCMFSSDCADALVCITVGDLGGVCTPQCSASADECGATASCSGVGALSVNVCQDDPDPQSPPKPEEQPKLPCMTDADCSELASGAICVEWKGERDCTIPCAAESDCDLPSAGGISVDFLACTADEADDARMGCVPDEACFADVLSCIGGVDIPGVPGVP
ncbi:MAG: hypothetical protein R3A51_21150 [Nannocystaceae bacterium]